MSFQRRSDTLQNAHISKFGRVSYPHHPWHGRKVRLLSRRVDHFRVEDDDGAIRCLPQWMLDEERCGHMIVVSAPQCSAATLLSLRALTDSLRANGASPA
jgi:hypothetical protein